MTIKNLVDHVALLGAERELGNIDEMTEEHFFHALNTALYTVNRLDPITKTVFLDCEKKTAPSGIVVIDEPTRTRYDFSGVSDHLRFRSVFEEWGGSLAEGEEYRIYGKELVFRADFDKTCAVSYECSLEQITVDTDEQAQLPLDDELCRLLPNLVAFYLLLDEDPEKSAACKAAYNEQVSMLRTLRPHAQKASYISTNNW